MPVDLDYRISEESLKDRCIVLGVTGGIAAYKAAEIVRLLKRRGADVVVAMTENAKYFVGPLTFQALTGNPVIDTMFQPGNRSGLAHTELADRADLVIVAPATANIIGKYRCGIADDFLSTFLMAIDFPVLLAPAMNPRMYQGISVTENLRVLRDRAVNVVGPAAGDTACGHVGKGRMSEPDVIVDHAVALLGRAGPLSGKKLMVTAGPTREMLDPVRFISNRSSGLMGYTVAAAAVERGAEVTLISGPATCRPHACVETIRVISAEEMKQAVDPLFDEMDITIMAAAVADWRPEQKRSQKWKKSGVSDARIDLISTADILEALGKRKRKNQILVGFAAETDNLLQEAKRKLDSKHLDLIVANDVSLPDRGFEVPTNAIVMYDRSGQITEVSTETKRRIADRILDKIQILSQS